MTNDSNVINMADFLVRRYHKLDDSATTLEGIVDDLSKQKKDKFAAPVRAKAERVREEAEAVKKHIKFLARGGRGKSIPTNGYAINVVPPAVTMNVRIDSPPTEE